MWSAKEPDVKTCVETQECFEKEETLLEAASVLVTSPVTLHRGNSNQKRQKKKDMRRKNEDSLAVVFMIIIFIFHFEF